MLRGKENGAEPDAALNDALDALEMRHARLLQEEDGEFDPDSWEPQRIALGGRIFFSYELYVKKY